MIVLLGKTKAPHESLGRDMLAAAPHRGSRYALHTVGNCLLGVATRPDYPYSGMSAPGKVMATVTGRIDNSQALSRDLPHHDLSAGTDADLLVAMFREFGAHAPLRLRGCFAGFVTDGDTVWCFRDHVGFQPLFYHDSTEMFVGASEARQVQIGARLPAKADLQVLEDIFYGRMPSDLPSALEGVARLPQGTVLTVDRSQPPKTRSYWNPEALLETGDVKPGQVRERFDELMGQATARCLHGQDAILLSGGVDSPAVAAFAAPEYRRRTGKAMGALSAVFPDLPSVDESALIALVAQDLGLESHTYQPTARGLDDVAEWCRRCGGPTPILSLPEIADSHARARQLGFTNLLTGEFAEFCIGNPVHMMSHLLARRRWKDLWQVGVAERRRGVTLKRLAQHILATFVPGRVATWYLHWRGLDGPQRIPDWLDADHVNVEPFRDDFLPPSRERWRQIQLDGTYGSSITMEADELCQVLEGVTVRRPFADIDLWEFFLGLPAQVKAPDMRFKSLLRQLLRGRVPDAILDRRDKTVFDDHVMAQIDYVTLDRFLAEAVHAIPGVDYPRLQEHLRNRDLTRMDWLWAQDLTRIHAFLETL